MKNGASILVVWLTVFIDLLGFSIIIPILPDLAVTLGGGEIALSVAALYALMNFLFSPFWGTLSDRYGRRPIILVSVLITALSQFLFGFVGSLGLLALQRCLAGIGSANISAANAYIADISTKENRTKNMGLIGAAFGMGFIIGPVIGGYVYEAYGLMGVGITSGLLSIFNFAMAAIFLKESLAEKNTTSKNMLDPISPLLKAMKNRAVRGLFLLNLLFIAAFALMQVTAAILWEDHFLLTKKDIGLVFAFIGFCSAIVQAGLVGILNKKFGEKRLLSIGLTMMMLALIAMPLAPSMEWELVALAFIALANGCVSPSILSLLSSEVSPKEQGNIMGLNQSLGSLGRVIGPVLGGILYSFDFHLPYFGGAFIIVLALLFIFDIFRKEIIK